VGTNPAEGLLYLDGRRRWKRRRRASGVGIELAEEVVQASDDIYLGRGGDAFLAVSSSYSCNCPSFLGLQLQDWRSGQASKRAQGMPIGGPLTPLGADPLNEVARVYRPLEWERNPHDSCKHIHATRWLLGCPTEAPGDADPLNDPYWSDSKEMAEVEEFVMPLRAAEASQTLSVTQRWEGLNGLPAAVSAGDALALTAYELPLLRSSSSGLLLLPLAGLTGDLTLVNARRGSLYAQAVEATNEVVMDRFNRLWPTADPAMGDSHVGDIWVGKGLEADAHPYEADGKVADTPFITPNPGGALAQP
jgi:hypothetical protein